MRQAGEHPPRPACPERSSSVKRSRAVAPSTSAASSKARATGAQGVHVTSLGAFTCFLQRACRAPGSEDARCRNSSPRSPYRFPSCRRTCAGGSLIHCIAASERLPPCSVSQSGICAVHMSDYGNMLHGEWAAIQHTVSKPGPANSIPLASKPAAAETQTEPRQSVRVK